MLFSVSIKYRYLGKKSIHRLYTEIPPLTENPPLMYIYGWSHSCVCQEMIGWCNSASWNMHFKNFHVKEIFADNFFIYLLMFCWKDVLYKTLPPP